MREGEREIGVQLLVSALVEHPSVAVFVERGHAAAARGAARAVVFQRALEHHAVAPCRQQEEMRVRAALPTCVEVGGIAIIAPPSHGGTVGAQLARPRRAGRTQHPRAADIALQPQRAADRIIAQPGAPRLMRAYSRRIGLHPKPRLRARPHGAGVARAGRGIFEPLAQEALHGHHPAPL